MSAPAASRSAIAAYARCEAITRRRAGNFFYGIRLLPRDKRRAMCAVYAFARRVDDIGDGELDPARKLELLAAQERALSRLGHAAGEAGGDSPAPEGARPGRDGDDAVMTALADASARFDLPLAALGDLIAGVRMDVEQARYERFEELVVYCRRVAGAIGRLCLAIFGTREGARVPGGARAEQLADDLGVALQLTNILRDVREDAQRGRVYLPAEDLARFGLLGDGSEPLHAIGSLLEGGSAEELVRFESERARAWFHRGLALVGLLDRRSAACVLAMTGIYRRLLDRIEADPGAALASRTALPAWEKAWVALSSLRGARPAARQPDPPREPAIGGSG
jgi:phytoene synthase